MTLQIYLWLIIVRILLYFLSNIIVLWLFLISFWRFNILIRLNKLLVLCPKWFYSAKSFIQFAQHMKFDRPGVFIQNLFYIFQCYLFQLLRYLGISMNFWYNLLIIDMFVWVIFLLIYFFILFKFVRIPLYYVQKTSFLFEQSKLMIDYILFKLWLSFFTFFYSIRYAYMKMID